NGVPILGGVHTGLAIFGGERIVSGGGGILKGSSVYVVVGGRHLGGIGAGMDQVDVLFARSFARALGGRLVRADGEPGVICGFGGNIGTDFGRISAGLDRSVILLCGFFGGSPGSGGVSSGTDRSAVSGFFRGDRNAIGAIVGAHIRRILIGALVCSVISLLVI